MLLCFMGITLLHTEALCWVGFIRTAVEVFKCSGITEGHGLLTPTLDLCLLMRGRESEN